MNKKELLLGDYFEAGKSKSSVSSKRSPVQHKLQSTIAQHYQTVCQLVSNQDMDIDLDPQIQDPVEKLVNIVAVIEYLTMKEERKGQCEDCQNYEKHLQKLEADVRQHIRLEQQLKLYQDSIQEKNQEIKKENKILEKEIESLKRKPESYKHLHEKMTRLQAQNEELRNQIKALKPKRNESMEKPSSSQGQYRKFETKSNLSEKFPLTRTINFSSNINSNQQRKSLDKKPVEPKTDTDRFRQSLTHKSSNNLRPPTDRKRYDDKSVIREKDKENQRRKTKVDIRK